MNIIQAIKDFYKFDSVLRELFGADADGMETRFLQNIIELSQKEKTKDNWIVIQDQDLAKIFLESFADKDKKVIIDSVLDDSLIIADILERCRVPQTSGYRKINQLIDTGLLISNGFVLASDGKKTKKYQTIFDDVKIDIEKNSIVIRVKLKKNSLSQSAILQIIKTK